MFDDPTTNLGILIGLAFFGFIIYRVVKSNKKSSGTGSGGGGGGRPGKGTKVK